MVAVENLEFQMKISALETNKQTNRQTKQKIRKLKIVSLLTLKAFVILLCSVIAVSSQKTRHGYATSAKV